MRGGSEPKRFAVGPSDSVYVPWPDDPLGEAEGAQVCVRARGADSETPWSDRVHVETGANRQGAKSNHFIIASGQAHSMLQHKIQLQAAVSPTMPYVFPRDVSGGD
ncbi:hypothetical protein VDGE_00620 [Verticillium dahliae]|uniref:Uncharacterized protein n=1 Tax=Verticillium dahliae TaxID=27337 RepID=A0A444S957_VERDA|nr:hypothetical protein VDGE_00620 [Verticillium dahliae]